MKNETKMLHRIPGGWDLTEFSLLLPPAGKSSLTIQFQATQGAIRLRFWKPYPIDSAFALTDGPGEVSIYDCSSDQLEEHKIKVEFFTEASWEFWAEAVDLLPIENGQPEREPER